MTNQESKVALDSIIHGGSPAQGFFAPYAEALLCISKGHAMQEIESQALDPLWSAIAKTFREALQAGATREAAMEIVDMADSQLVNYVAERARLDAIAASSRDVPRREVLMGYSLEETLSDLAYVFGRESLCESIRHDVKPSVLILTMYSVLGIDVQEQAQKSIIAVQIWENMKRPAEHTADVTPLVTTEVNVETLEHMRPSTLEAILDFTKANV